MAKTIIIKSVSIQDFKGIKKQDINFNDDLTVINGKNASGKTTIYDAICFCLFKKNGKGQSKFKWEPLTTKNKIADTFNLKIDLTVNVNGEDHLFTRTITKAKSKKAIAKESYQITSLLSYN